MCTLHSTMAMMTTVYHHRNQFHEVHAADCFAMSFVLLYVDNQLSDQLNFMLINLMNPPLFFLSLMTSDQTNNQRQAPCQHCWWLPFLSETLF